MDLIESYLAIERARFEERLQITIDVPAELRNLRIPPLIIQPLVENAIKHGIAPRKAGGEVIVSARLKNGLNAPSLNISVVDTGSGVSKENLEQGRRRGVGLTNIEKRLEHFYGPTATVELHSQPDNGTTVEIQLPLGSTMEKAASFMKYVNT